METIPKLGNILRGISITWGFGYRGGKKVLLYDRREILPTVSAKEASEEMMKYHEHVGGGHVDLHFHGDDHKTIKEFVRSQGCGEGSRRKV